MPVSHTVSVVVPARSKYSPGLFRSAMIVHHHHENVVAAAAAIALVGVVH